MPGLVVLLLAAPTMGAPQPRLGPAPFVVCDRNHLTSFTGRIVSLTRGRERTTLAMRTDEATDERFAIAHAGRDASAWFFAGERPFTADDWASLLPNGRLRAGARATVWVCNHEPNPWVAVEPPR